MDQPETATDPGTLRRQRHTHILRQRFCPNAVPPGQQHHEFIAAHPRHRVARGAMRTQQLRDIDQTGVARRMAVPVVQLLEPVKVEEQQAHPLPARARIGQYVVRPCCQSPTIEQPGQRIMHRLETRAAQFRQILDHRDEKFRLPIVIPHHRHRQVDPDDRAIGANIAFLQRIARKLAIMQPRQQVFVDMQVVGMRDLLKPGAQQSRGIMAADFAKARVDHQERPVQPDMANAHRRVQECRLEPALREREFRGQIIGR